MKETNDNTLEIVETQVRSQVISITKLLRDKAKTVGFAESCTGGLLSSFVTELAGVSDVFIGSIISYDNKVKQNILDVPSEVLITKGAVSSETAVAMAESCRTKLAVSYSVSVTGIAGPSGGTATKPVGTVVIAVSGLKNATNGEQKKTEVFSHVFEGDRKLIQTQSCLEALKHLENFIKN